MDGRYRFKGKTADQILEDLDNGTVQSERGGEAFEVAAAAIQAAVARENRRAQFRLTVLSLTVAGVSLLVAAIALLHSLHTF